MHASSARTSFTSCRSVRLAATLLAAALFAGCETMGPIDTPETGDRLLVGQHVGLRVTSHGRSSSLNGNAAPLDSLEGAATQIQAVKGIAVNSAGQLVVYNDNQASPTIARISIFADAADIEANQAPIRTVTGANTGLDRIGIGFAFDRTRDIAYCALDFEQSILAFEGTADDTFDGDLPAARTITFPDFASIQDIFVTAENELWVVDFKNEGSQFGEIYVFGGASGLDGEQMNPRVLTRPVLTGDDEITSLGPIFIDSSDTLYLVERTEDDRQFIGRYPNASSLTGEIAPASMFQVDGPALRAYTALAIDSDGVGYLARSRGGVGEQQSGVAIFENFAGLTGLQSPTRHLQGQGTGMNLPSTIAFIDE